MVFIRNKDLYSRVQAYRKKLEKEEEDYLKSFKELAESSVEPAEEEQGDSRSFLAKAFDQINPLDNDKTWKQSERVGNESAFEETKELGSTLFSGLEKVGDTAESITGIRDRRIRHWDKERRAGRLSKEEYSKLLEQELADTEWAGSGFDEEGNADSLLDRARDAGGVSLEATSELVPFMKGAKLANMTTKGGAIGGGALGATHATGRELTEDEFDIENVGLEAALGLVVGAGGGKLASRSMAKREAASKLRADRELFSGVDESADDVARSMDAEDAFKASQPDGEQKLLTAGQDYKQSRLDEIDQRLDELRGRGSEFVPEEKTIDNLGVDPDARLMGDTEFNRNMKEGKVSVKKGTTSTDTPGEFKSVAEEARALMRERKAIENEMEGLSSIEKFDNASAEKLDISDPQFSKAVDNELQAVENASPEAATGRVNALVDYFRTPTNVLRKLGLNETADTVEKSFTKYRQGIVQSNKMVRDWEARVGGNPESSKRIFQYLDGDNINLYGEELKVAEEMKAHLREWADKLDLPEEARVTDYITHIFDDTLQGKNIDPSLSSILDSKGSNRVYNPFTKKRLGKQGYKEDAFAAMDAYLRKGNREVHMNPALKATSDVAKGVDDRTARYLIKLNSAIAMKPTKLDTIINDVVSSIPGVEGKLGAQAGTRLMKGWRNMVYRGTLGMNVGSAIRNLTQGTNTFAELGSVRTLQGYSKLVRTFAEAAEQKAKGQKVTAWDELNEHGILGDAFHQQDRSMSAIKKGFEKADPALWAMFDFAEKINRASAYFGAKAKGLSKGMNEADAIEYAKDIVGKTQFRFNDIETPLILRGQGAKTLGQFQSFNLKQAEFLATKVGKGVKGAVGKGEKGDVVELYKLARWAAANIAVASTVGNVLGMKWTDAIPDFGAFRGVRSPLLTAGGSVMNVIQGENEYGQPESRGELAKDAVGDLFGLVVPGGTQIKKTYEGMQAVDQGGSYTDAGNLRYTVEDDATNMARAGLFGQYNLDEGQEYFDNGREAFSDRQTELIENAPDGEEQAYEDIFRSIQEKQDTKQNVANKIREEVKNKNFAKAKRLADEHNAGIEKELSLLAGKIGQPPQEVIDYIRDFKVSYDYYTR